MEEKEEMRTTESEKEEQVEKRNKKKIPKVIELCSTLLSIAAIVFNLIMFGMIFSLMKKNQTILQENTMLQRECQLLQNSVMKSDSFSGKEECQKEKKEYEELLKNLQSKLEETEIFSSTYILEEEYDFNSVPCLTIASTDLPKISYFCFTGENPEIAKQFPMKIAYPETEEAVLLLFLDAKKVQLTFPDGKKQLLEELSSPSNGYYIPLNEEGIYLIRYIPKSSGGLIPMRNGMQFSSDEPEIVNLALKWGRND